MPVELDQDTFNDAASRLVKKDKKLAGVIRRVGMCGLQWSDDPYRSLVRSVVYQQLNGRAASAIDQRFRSNFAGRYPKPSRLADAPVEIFQQAGLSKNKMTAIKAIAEEFASRRLTNRALRRMADDEVIEAVTRLKGVGLWTAHMLLMFGLGRLDILPVTDFGVRKGFSILHGSPELPSIRDLEAHAEAWSPYRSIASWYLWRVADGL